MRKMLCEIDLEKAQGYPGRYLEHFSTTNRAPAYAECRELIAKLGQVNRAPRGGHNKIGWLVEIPHIAGTMRQGHIYA